MISNVSRYYNAKFGEVTTSNGKASIYAYRLFDVPPKVEYELYTINEGDRIDMIASARLNDSRLWHKIMDINPEIHDPFKLTPGTVIRLPHV